MGKQLRALLLLSPLMILGCDELPESSSEVITEKDLVEETAEFASRDRNSSSSFLDFANRHATTVAQ